MHGTLQGEGGGLGLARGLARVAGGAWKDRLQYSTGVQHVNVFRGADGQDPYRNTGVEGLLQTANVSDHVSQRARVWR